MSDTPKIRRLRDNSVDPLGEFPLDPADYLFYLLFHLIRQRDAAFDEVMAGIGLTLPRWRALSVIWRLEGCTMKELSQYTGVDRTTLTRAVDALVEEGLASRTVPQHDRRQVTLGLTEAGEIAYTRAVGVLMAFNRSKMRGVDEDETRQGARLMRKLLRNLFADEEIADEVIAFGRADHLGPAKDEP